jgi:hypothetical protein
MLNTVVRKKKGRAKRAGNIPTLQSGPSPSKTAREHIPIFAQRQKVSGQLYYNYQVSLTSVSPGLPNVDFYWANSVYDPDSSGVGHQAMGFDQMMVFYEHFAVTKSSAECSFFNNSTFPMRVGIYLSPDAVALSDPIKLMENGLCATAVVDAVAQGTSFGGSGERIKTVRLDCDVVKYFGKRSELDLLDDEKMTGTVAADPAEGVYFGVVAWSHGTAAAVDVSYDILLSYDTIYFEPRKATVSSSLPQAVRVTRTQKIVVRGKQ